MIYDWRAPVSGLFYDYDKGPASYEAPGGKMSGEVIAKWQYKIRRGKLVYAFESDVKIDDEVLKEELSASGDVKLKNIIRTIQKEQNAIIRNTKDRILVIQGGAECDHPKHFGSYHGDPGSSRKRKDFRSPAPDCISLVS